MKETDFNNLQEYLEIWKNDYIIFDKESTLTDKKDCPMFQEKPTDSEIMALRHWYENTSK